MPVLPCHKLRPQRRYPVREPIKIAIGLQHRRVANPARLARENGCPLSLPTGIGESDFYPANVISQVNLVRNTHHPDEDEFLFSPYSVFTVGACNWADRTVTLTPALDNTREPEDLPLASWI